MTGPKELIDKLHKNQELSLEEWTELIKNRTPELSEYLFELAREERHKYYGHDVYVRGLIEFTNYCRNDCLYCGIRKSNAAAHRYRLDEDTILRCCQEGYDLGFRTFVLQGGEDGYFTETSPIKPSSPYSASKASSDLIAFAYKETFKMNVNVTNCSNNYGPYQHNEKLIPHMIKLALNDEKLPVYGTGKNIRDWLYVEDHCKAIDMVFHKGVAGERYNIGGHNEKRNIDIVKLILKRLGKSEDLIEYVEDRKGHDYRYAIDPSKIKAELGWEPETKFEDGIVKTIDWYLANPEWLQ